jgi:hypothetical protein
MNEAFISSFVRFAINEAIILRRSVMNLQQNNKTEGWVIGVSKTAWKRIKCL